MGVVRRLQNFLPVATNQINGTILPKIGKIRRCKTHVIKLPWWGPYRAPSPDAPPFVELDSRISKGQTMCIIEAMKLMNEIEAEVTGRVVKILVENGGSVEYGQELFLIEEE